MKITFVEPDGQGGLAHFAYELCQALEIEGHSVTLVTSTNYELSKLPHKFTIAAVMRLWPAADAAAPEKRRQLRYRIFAGGRRVLRGLRLTTEWLRVTRKLVKDRPDAVIFSEIAFPHLAFAPHIAKRAGIATCQICHEYTERDAKNKIAAKLSLKASQFLFRQFDWIFFLSEATRKAFLDHVDFDRERTSRIPHGSQDLFGASTLSGRDLKLELGIPEHEPVALYFGYIRPSKGISELLDAFARASWRNRSWLVIAGHVTKFSDVAELEEKTRNLGLGERVIFRTSYIPNERVAAYFEMARFVVLPYRSASQSGVLHLAYGQSRPVIATAVGGLAEDVLDGQTGLLVPPLDVDALAVALDRLFENPQLAEAMGRRGKELSETYFSWPAAARIITEKLSLLMLKRPEGSGKNEKMAWPPLEVDQSK
jgi:glycosyltransferase involved in cell wall biosynthesis